MAGYDTISRMNDCFKELELALTDLERFLNQLELLQARAFVLPDIEKGAEHDPTLQISVTPYNGDTAHQLGLQHFKRLFIHHNAMNISSKSAVRLPGVMCYAVDRGEQRAALLLLEEVNKRKAELEHIVTVESGLAQWRSGGGDDVFKRRNPPEHGGLLHRALHQRQLDRRDERPFSHRCINRLCVLACCIGCYWRVFARFCPDVLENFAGVTTFS